MFGRWFFFFQTWTYISFKAHFSAVQVIGALAFIQKKPQEFHTNFFQAFFLYMQNSQTRPRFDGPIGQ